MLCGVAGAVLLVCCSPIAGKRVLTDEQLRQSQEDHVLELVPVVGEDGESGEERDIIIPDVRRSDVYADDTVIGPLHLRFNGSSDERAMNACLYPFAEALVGRLELPAASAPAPVEAEAGAPAGEEAPDSGSEREELQLTARYRVELLDIITEITELDAPPHFYRYGRARFDRTGRRALFPLLLTSSRNSSVAQVVCEFSDEQWQVLGFAIDINELQSTPAQARPLFNPLARDETGSGG